MAHGSIVDLSDKGRLAVLEFTATSVAVLEKEQKCKVGIRRYGRKDNQVTFRYFHDPSEIRGMITPAYTHTGSRRDSG